MTDATVGKFEAAISLAVAIDENQRKSAHFKHRLDAIADAAHQMGLDSLSETLSGPVTRHHRAARPHSRSP